MLYSVLGCTGAGLGVVPVAALVATGLLAAGAAGLLAAGFVSVAGAGFASSGNSTKGFNIFLSRLIVFL
jgi:hypothetical protein